MKKNNFILCTLSSLLVGMLFFFVSCSSKPNNLAEDDSETTEEETVASAEESAEADGESKKSEDKVEELEATLDDANKAATDDPALEVSSTTEEKKEEAVASAEKTEDAFAIESGSNAAKTEEVASAAIEAAPSVITPPEPPMDIPAPKVRAAAPSVGKVPRIPGKAIKVRNTMLNRFYFVRKGDTPAKVSTLFYGSTDHAKDISKWNSRGGSWKPGKLIYYSSPTNPTDTLMQSFYQERSVPSEDVEVATGERLTTIAKKTLGDRGSWVEIAVVNGLESGAELEVGKKLTLYPKDLSNFGANTATSGAVASNQVPSSSPQAQVPSNTPAQQAQTEVVPPVDKMPAPPVEQKPLKKPAPKGFDIALFLQQNLFTLAMGGIVGMLLITLLAVNKRKKKGKKDDFMDDGFAAPKAKRK